ncbi:PAS domain S-box protein [Pseudanabaena sp. FACHB-1998]|uniref:PAS domain S-box protein n=1 Tax=Pseudanabaena sp. FACHB-1998 TaxID=2692858 RepID=UPI0016803FFC|nr:PAS domain S-box protein [Pseudanabaena sp. FACHB-1998]MBD2175773.1 PAS domain S-box protein [Pseudanabaena sp. FACHB-1998]
MLKPEIPVNESDRLVALDRYKILDTLPEQVYDDLTQLAADICGTPIALISLVDKDRQWFKSRVGLDATETPRDISFCGHVIADGEILNISDATQDDRFADNPLVLQDPSIRFYAGIPLITPDLYALGTLCVIDRQPRILTPKQIQQLQALSRLAVGQLELRLSGEELVKRTANLKARVEREQLVTMIANKTATSLPLPEILETAVKKLRSLLGCDRLIVWQFQSDGSGLVIAESVGEDWRVALNEAIKNPNFREDIALLHPDGRAIAKENIFIDGYADDYLQWLAAYQVKSNLVVPLLVSGQLWGFLEGQQCMSYREWQNTDLVLMDEITVQIAIAIQQADAMAERQQLHQELETKVEERTQELWRVNSLQRAILDGADYALISTDLNGVIQTFNKAAERMLGYSASEVVGQCTPEIIHEPQEVIDRAAIISLELGQNIPIGFEVFAAKARLGLASENEWTYIRKDGSRFPVLLSITTLKDANQQIIGFLGIAQDISDRKLSEEKLRKRDIHLKTAQRISKLGSWEFNPYTDQVIWSDEVFRIFGRDPAMGTPSFDTIQEQIHPDDRVHHLQVVQTAITTIQPYDLEVRFYRCDGSFGYFMARGEPIVDATGQLTQLIGTVLDITDRKLAEQQLKQHLTAIESAVDGIAILKDDCYVYLNSSHVHLFGYDHPQDLLGKSWTTLYSPEELQRIEREVFPVLGEHRHWEGEAIAIRKDGTTFTEGLSLTLTEDNLLICVCRDVSARKEAERQLQQTAAQLEASNQELEAFAYSVSHDLRSPLRAIDGFSNALIEDYGDLFDDDARDYFDRIRRNIQRMGMLIDDLLRLSRVSRSEIQYGDVNLSALVQDQIDELQAINPERQVKIVIAPNIIVSADRTLMQVVISNLVQNAWKFTSHHDSALIEFGVLQQEDRLIYFMRDDGAGFNMTFANMLFGVFQRLHNTNEFPGTGIGLATVQRAIHRHGGRVWAEGVVEQGATIYFTVPNTSIKKGA